jgi:hypothetical protein
LRALDVCGGNRTAAGRMLGISRQMVLYLITKYAIDVPPLRRAS